MLDKIGMRFLVTSLSFLALDYGCIYTLPFLPKGVGHWFDFLLDTVFHAQMGLVC